MRQQKHVCHVHPCGAKVNPCYLMCKPHWDMVPQDLRDEIYKYYRLGQEVDKKPTREWLVASLKAIRYVSRLERENANKRLPSGDGQQTAG